MAVVARRRMRIIVAAGSVATAAALVVLAFYLGHQDLDRADKIASVLDVLLNAAAVAIAGAGLWLSWWMGRTPRPDHVR